MSAPEGYAEAKWAELHEISQRMRALPEVAQAIEARRTLVLTCPRGHKITTVELVDEGEYLSARPIGDVGRKRGAAAVADSPHSLRTVCMEPGCPAIVDRAGWCDEHGGRASNHIDHLATRFTCPASHSGKQWSDRITTTRLLKVLTVAILTGASRVPVTGVSRRP